MSGDGGDGPQATGTVLLGTVPNRLGTVVFGDRPADEMARGPSPERSFGDGPGDRPHRGIGDRPHRGIGDRSPCTGDRIAGDRPRTKPR